MPLSSAYAAPIELELRPGVWERGGRVVAGLLALSALALSDLSLLSGLFCAWLAVLILVRDAAKAARRPARMRLYADGGIECPVSCRSAPARDRQRLDANTLAQAGSEASRASALLHTGDDLMVPATLLQASSFLGLTQLQWADADDRRHACILFPDRVNRGTHHRLRVWLATHRPDVPSGMLSAGSTPR